MKKERKRGLIPAIKKDVESFLLEERGDISKQVLISLGAMIAGIESMNLATKAVNAQSISAKHQHCDPPHCSGGGGGWHGSCHSNGCNPAHGSHSSGRTHGSVNPAHANNIVLNYG